MRVLVVCVAALVAGSCSAHAGVVAEHRVEIVPDTIAPVESAPPPSPAETELPRSVEELVLVNGDVPGWSIRGPGSMGRTTYSPSGCKFLDTVRGIDDRGNRGSTGSSVSGTFYNFVVDSNTVEDAAAVLDAAERAWSECTGLFSASLGPLDVPSGGWRSAGLMISEGGATVHVGYWQRGTQIVKLRVTGSNGRLTFPVLADAVARKLETGSALADDQPAASDPLAQPPETAPPATANPDPGVYTEPWMDHSLASFILESDEVGAAWTRHAVTIGTAVVMPGAICGYEPPGALAGISAPFLRSDSSAVLQQDVAESDMVTAQAWVDFYRVLSSCDDGSGVIYSALPIAANAAGADDVAGVLLESPPEAVNAAAVMSVVARYGGIVVMLTWRADRADPVFETMPTAEQMAALLELAAWD